MQFSWIEKFDDARQNELFDLFRKEWWTSGRSFEDVVHMLEHSDITLGCCSMDGRLAGFARVLTDYTFKAFVFDVIVNDHFRGQGVGRLMMENIIARPTLKRVTSFELYCQDDNISFYRKLGFVPKNSNLMALARPR